MTIFLSQSVTYNHFATSALETSTSCTIIICLTSSSIIHCETEVKVIRQPTRPVWWLPSSDITHARRTPRHQGAIHSLTGRTTCTHRMTWTQPSLARSTVLAAVSKEIQDFSDVRPCPLVNTDVSGSRSLAACWRRRQYGPSKRQ